eukprot:9292922-Heterocapsa_arctica.AAC.1
MDLQEQTEDHCRRVRGTEQLLHRPDENKRKGENKFAYIFYLDLANFTYARWLDSTKAMKTRCYPNDGKKADIVEAMPGMGWTNAETKVIELEL